MTSKKIFDCFTYAGEEELLMLRLEILSPVVDKFVIAEGTRTFTGKPKELRFDPERFERFRDRISYIVVDDLEAAPKSPWENEYHQRNALIRGLADAAPHDWVLLSDVDEIPAPEALSQFQPEKWRSALLHQRNFYYFLDNELIEADAGATDVTWAEARLTTVFRLRDWFGSMQSLRAYRTTGPLRSLKRWMNKRLTQHIPQAGWHFSYLMTPEQIIKKIESFSHSELDLPKFKQLDTIRQKIEAGDDLFGRNWKFAPARIDSSFPEFLRVNLNQYKHWLRPDSINNPDESPSQNEPQNW